MVVEAFVPSVNQSIETGIREIRIQVSEPGNDGFLNFGIGSEMTSCQTLLQRSEEMKIPSCEIQAVERVFLYISSETLLQITCNWGRMWSGVVIGDMWSVQHSTFRDQLQSFSADYLVQTFQRGTITDIIPGSSTDMKINQYILGDFHTLVVLKHFGHNFLREWRSCEFLVRETRGVSLTLMLCPSQVSHDAPTFRTV